MRTKYIHRILNHFFKNSYLSSTEKKIQKWLIDDKWSSEKDNALQLFWKRIPFSHPNRDTYRMLRITNEIIKGIDKEKKPLRMPRITTTGLAVIILIILLAGFYIYKQQSVQMIIVETANNEQKVQELPDGTTVLLNSDSKLTYSKQFGKIDREVTLEGEAFFTAVSDDEKPFLVQAGVLSIKASGSKFNVCAYPNNDKMIVATRSGCMIVNIQKLREDGIKYILSPNNQVIFDQTDHSVSVDTVINPIEHWKEGELLFEDATFNDVIKTLERRFDISIDYDKKEIPNKWYTVQFVHNETLEEILDVLKKMAGNFEYQRKGDRITLKKKFEK